MTGRGVNVIGTIEAIREEFIEVLTMLKTNESRAKEMREKTRKLGEAIVRDSEEVGMSHNAMIDIGEIT